MHDRHALAYAALVVVYTVMALILCADQAYPHAACVMTAALVYAFLSWRA